MSNTSIFYTVEFNINNGKLDDFKKVAEQCIARVRDNEPEMISYEWFFNKAETACFVNEHHTSSESMLTHLGNVGALLEELLGMSRLARLDVFGNPNEAATEALGKLGANINAHWSGFTR